MAELRQGRSGLIPTRLPGGVHYAWLIVAVLAAVQIIGSSIGMAAGIMIPPLTDPEGKFGWSVGVVGIAMALYYLVGAACAPISGWLGDRIGAQKMMALGGVLYLISMILLGSLTELWQFFIVFGGLLATTQSISMVPLMASVSGWFRRRLGLGTGILWAAGGIGTAILAPLLGYLVETTGWNITFWAVGAVGGGIILLLTPFLRNKPADIGVTPYGSSPQDPPPVVRSAPMEKLRVQAFNHHMRRTRAFWNLPVIHALGCAGHGIVLIFSIPIAVQQGLTLTEAAVILTLISLVSIPSRFLTPVLAENYGPRLVMASCLFIQGVTVFILFWAQELWAFYLFAALFGLGFGGEWTGYLVINRQYFGSGPMGTCYGWQMTGAMMGHAVTTALAGAVIYLTGSYTAILALSAFFSLAGVVVIATLEPTHRILIPNWENSLPPEARTVPPANRPFTGGAPAAEPAAGDS